MSPGTSLSSTKTRRRDEHAHLAREPKDSLISLALERAGKGVRDRRRNQPHCHQRDDEHGKRHHVRDADEPEVLANCLEEDEEHGRGNEEGDKGGHRAGDDEPSGAVVAVAAELVRGHRFDLVLREAIEHRVSEHTRPAQPTPASCRFALSCLDTQAEFLDDDHLYPLDEAAQPLGQLLIVKRLGPAKDQARQRRPAVGLAGTAEQVCTLDGKINGGQLLDGKMNRGGEPSTTNKVPVRRAPARARREKAESVHRNGVVT